jgi:hypothetical protein
MHMYRMIRSITALSLALILSLTSVSMALARGDMAVHGTMILCLGGMQVTVAIGPDGQPILQEHVCPDCTIGALALSTDRPAAKPTGLSRRLAQTPHALSIHPSPVHGGQARGPPASSA